jgi:uncharacterized membrane protein YbaN (DUF454 family)
VRILWLVLGLASLALAVIGIVLPLLPTVPFLLLAAFFFARSSARLYDWLIAHPLFGPPIRDWRAHGAIRRRVKWLATLSVALVVVGSLAAGAGWQIVATQVLVLTGTLTFVWTRPDGPRPPQAGRDRS